MKYTGARITHTVLDDIIRDGSVASLQWALDSVDLAIDSFTVEVLITDQGKLEREYPCPLLFVCFNFLGVFVLDQ
jgi:hypothetical protein